MPKTKRPDFDPALWVDRYTELKDNREELDRVFGADIETVQKLQATITGIGPGASIETPGRGALRADTAAWNWLLPLLEELVSYREKNG